MSGMDIPATCFRMRRVALRFFLIVLREMPMRRSVNRRFFGTETGAVAVVVTVVGAVGAVVGTVAVAVAVPVAVAGITSFCFSLEIAWRLMGIIRALLLGIGIEGIPLLRVFICIPPVRG